MASADYTAFSDEAEDFAEEISSILYDGDNTMKNAATAYDLPEGRML